MTQIKGPAVLVAQFLRDEPPFHNLEAIGQWFAGLGYKSLQIPTWDERVFDLDAAAEHLSALYEYIAVELGIFYLLASVTAIGFLVWLAASRFGHVRLGDDDSEPEFRTLSWITAKHHVHHENMHKGNYATITLFYDKLFGTLD